MQKLTVVVNNKSGLHARPAGLFVRTANKFKASITVSKNGRSVNGKSIMGILGIAASKGDELEIIAEGHDEIEAINEIKVLFNSKLIHE
ncbi:HPr family phosphocarrier protein [Paramaledivibacter caminithermalis]|jgi:phosphocarrier protein|uniref:Phosphocarrier protein n=1 Tax=Paramaledivibacter caminithermalis (strain DSM 15212 / CIP 107654 / DViRD3) TaxID=1121301 RepID=A0A1M6PGP4_PARC5|nr:HPr family phosphocarrier protein [Paramaledivibacter caminithermalis]SHK07057.1 phosphocarrier protein [Paramaledivibacter caminithermalis DSM 15212]